MSKTLTLKEAKEKGYRIIRGSYTGTTDDRADRWYIDNLNSNIIDKRGPGFRTRQDALEALSERIALGE